MSESRIVAETPGVFYPSSTVISADVDGEVVLLDARSGDYFGLNRVAARAWTLLEETRNPAVVESQLLREFDVDADVLARDLSALWSHLWSSRLLESSERD